MEMGQSYHHEFWTIGLNVHGNDCDCKAVAAMPAAHRGGTPATTEATVKTFYPLVDTKLFRPRPQPRHAESSQPLGNGIGVELWRLQANFLIYRRNMLLSRICDLPCRVPEAQFELAMNIAADDPGTTTSYNGAAGKLPIRTGSRARRTLTAATWPARLLNLPR